MEFIELYRQYRYLQNEIDRNIKEVIDETDFILGKKVLEFEQKIADYVGVKYALSCSSGTAALQLIYMANGIGRGDAVFCPDMTFIASIEPACMLGAVPVFCDINIDTYNISPESLECQIRRVLEEGKLVPKAIVAVDIFGAPADYSSIREIAKKYNLLLIEDAAQSMGGSYNGEKCGALGDVAATSFFPSKPLGCYGDGGAVFTNDDGMIDLIKSLRVHGKGKTKYDNIHIGINSRLDSIQAAVLIPKLRLLDEEMDKRQKIAAFYSRMMKEIIRVPFIDEKSVSAYAQFVLMADSSEQRAHIQNVLKENEIPTRQYYSKPMHKLPVFEGNNTYGEEYRNANKCSELLFGIPFSPYISKNEMEWVAECVLRAFE